MSDNYSNKDSTTSETNWGGIKWTSDTSTTFKVNSRKFKENLEIIATKFEKTDKEINKGRKRRACKRCKKTYYEDEGVSDGYCTLDCKYVQCIIEEDNDDGKSI